MKITDHFLAIPPHLSVEWSEVSSLVSEGESIIISLKNGDKAALSHLSSQEREEIFKGHEKFLTRSANKSSCGQKESLDSIVVSAGPFPFVPGFQPGILPGMPQGPASLAFPFFHNPEQSSASKLPDEIVEKLASVLKMVLPALMEGISEPVESCFCPFCQIAGHVHKKEEKETLLISDEDLRFRDWQIVSQGENVYSVESPIDPLEKYTVFLGDPLGCTCGNPGCEHIVAVLRT